MKRNCASSWLFTKTVPRCTVNKKKLYQRKYGWGLELGKCALFEGSVLTSTDVRHGKSMSKVDFNKGC
jgi:hypothetical protein